MRGHAYPWVLLIFDLSANPALSLARVDDNEERRFAIKAFEIDCERHQKSLPSSALIEGPPLIISVLL